MLVTKTYNGPQASMLYTFFDEAGRVIKTVDSSGNLRNTTTYQYNPMGLLQSVTFNTSDTARGLNETEQHSWHYNTNGQPQRMIRTMNQQPSLEVTFNYDASGNVTEEIWSKKTVEIDRIFYYYNERNNLTDIVRFNKKAGRLLPDYMFEVDANGTVIQKISIPVNSNDYQIWRYQFNDKGLKTREALYNRDKQLVGKIEYRYRF
jgi:YD repeat-containing protein